MAVPENTAWADRLHVEGVNFKGYGSVPKYAMRDKDLSITAKGIYAYFCAMSGSGDSTFPSLATIQTHLQLGNRAYYAHRQQLIDQGYLLVSSKERISGEFSQNLYTLVSNPKKFAEKVPENEWQSVVYSTIVQEGIKSVGYGDIPRSVMQDDRMDIKAKAVYAYFASYAGSGKTAFPGVPHIIEDLGISKTTYQKAMRTLQDLGYIVVKQNNGCGNGVKKNGFGVNSYHLIDKPDLTQPKNAQTVNAKAVDAKSVKSQTVSAQMVNAQTTIAQTMNAQTTNNTILTNNTLSSKTNQSSIATGPPRKIDEGWDVEETEFEDELKRKLDYNNISKIHPNADMSMVDELILLMVSACEGSSSKIRIGREELPKKLVKKRFLSLEYDHLAYVRECVERKRGEIRNIRAYYLAALYHAPETMNCFYDNMVREDLERSQ